MDVAAPELAEHDPADTGDIAREEAELEHERVRERLIHLQDRRCAKEQRSLLVVLQGIDAAGKDGTVKHVLRGANPASVRVYGFKEPVQRGARARHQQAYEAANTTSTPWAPWYSEQELKAAG